jgi:regulator of cell morphogenesis and NO signaling
MINVQGKTVREIALEKPLTTRVFEEYKIDYCCHGDTPFDVACRNAGVIPDEVRGKIDDVLSSSGETADRPLSDLPLSEIIRYILDRHHVYTREEIAHLTPLMAKVASRHGEHYSYLLELKDLFDAICEDLEPHMQKEERVLFPYIEDLEYRQSNGFTSTFPPFGTVQNPVRVMATEHETVGDMLSKMRQVTRDYELPNGACPSFTALYHRLREFERDIHQHIHLENNLLFPRAIDLEQKAFE